MRMVFVAALLLSGAAWAQSTVYQGNGNPNVYPWKVYSVAPSGSSSATASSNAVYYPAATSTSLTGNGTACTAAGGASCTIILASIELGAWSNITITIRNSDAADALTNVLVEWSPDNSNWEVWDSTSFAALAAGAQLSMAISGNSRRYLRIEARAAVDSAAVVTLTMNDG